MSGKTQSTGTTKPRTRKTKGKSKTKAKSESSGPSAASVRSVWAAAVGKSVDDLDAHIVDNEAHEAAARLGQAQMVLQAEAEADPISRFVEGATARYGVVRSVRRGLQYKGEIKEAIALKGEAVAVKDFALGIFNRFTA